MSTRHVAAPSRLLLNKVPEVTLYFWIIKVLCTTVGEAAADFLNVNLNFGLTGTSVVTGILTVLALGLQFRADRYVPGRYWLSVALVSVFGTLVTDILTDSLGVPLETSTLVFSVLLAITFLLWYRSEGTLSIHSILTRRREAFYWSAILFTFALGTATGDLMAQVLGLGYLVTGGIVAGVIAVVAVAWRGGLNPILAFWFIYILTRPLGASIGDLLSQPTDQGGIGLGATLTSVVFLVAIAATVTYLSVTKADVIARSEVTDRSGSEARGGLWQTVVVVALVLVVSAIGYFVQKASLAADPSATASASSTSPGSPGAVPAPASPGAPAVAPTSPLGDLSTFRVITQNTLTKLEGGDQAGATARVDDLESSWDKGQARLKPEDEAAWTTIDGKIDTVLRELRATNPDPTTEKAALQDLLGSLG